jgi:SAM-dependent methyltransferase
MLSSYEEIANEYYDAHRHPTCANFRQASRSILKRWLVHDRRLANRIWDVGAGASLVAELLVERRASVDGLAILDCSPAMLRHSEPWAASGAELFVASVTEMPTGDASSSLVVSSLGDAYNEPALWIEIARVLAPKGTCVYTTPSHDWATRFRADAPDGGITAEFELADGRSIRVPSLVYPRDEQTQMIEAAGLYVEDIGDVPLAGLSGDGPISEKLQVVADGQGSVVTAYRIRRPG